VDQRRRIDPCAESEIELPELIGHDAGPDADEDMIASFWTDPEDWTSFHCEADCSMFFTPLGKLPPCHFLVGLSIGSNRAMPDESSCPLVPPNNPNLSKLPIFRVPESFPEFN